MSEVLRILLLLALVGTCVNQCKIPTCEWGGLMNTYRKGIGTALQGSQTVIASLSRRGYGIPLQPGDLLLIIQMQGAHINPENSIAYGDGSTGSGVTNLENVGVYEFVRVDDVHTELTSIEITLSSPLVHSYESLPISDVSGASTFQVVRVPECEVATLIGDVVCASWDGESGGIVALNAQKSITFAGNEIRCPGRGFRGAGPLLFMSQQPLDSTDDYVSTSRILTTDGNALKGEGIAGTPLRVRARDGTITGTINDPFGYPGGDFAVGAPGNAGGGGNEHNNGGGGGGLGGRGGDGGKFYLSVIQSNGLGGGAVLDGSNVPYEDRLFLGGGGGAGHANNGQNFGWGGVGGGIVIIIAPRFLDYVVVDVSGSNGNPASIVEIDATGGGGAGGTAVLASPNGRLEHAGISVNAMGGRAYQAADGHGGGGGGGGGIILVEQNNVGGTVIPMLDGGTIIPIGAADPRDGDPGFPGKIAYITLNNMLGTIFLGFPSCSSSLSPTPSMTSSGTSSGTSTHSTTGSTSLSVTRSISITGSVTISITPTTSPSETKTSTASPSETRTVTRSISPTSTASKTPPATTSPTPSVSGSSSFSISLSSSISPLPIPVTVSASTKTPVANSTAPQPQETPSTGIKPTVILPSTSPFAIPSEIGVGNGGGVFVGPRDEGTEIIFLPPTEDAIEAINEFSIASNIVNIISLINGVESQPNGPVTICLEVESKDDACLSYYNEKTREWECEDPCLEYKGGVACGETDHFTNFAVILSGGGNGIGGRCSSNEGDWILGAGWKDSILIGCVTGVCCCFVVFVILLGTFLPKLRQKGHNNVTIVGE